jgi:protein-tyrosine phosphatase
MTGAGATTRYGGSGITPFTVLHVCMGNICRSPMADLLLTAEATRLMGDKAESLFYSHGAGTGGWHQGERMDPAAARQVRLRGGEPDGFRARKLRSEQIEASDLVLTATAEQLDFVVGLVPDAADRSFVLGQFGRLLRIASRSALVARELPRFAPEPQVVYARGVALVEEINGLRAGRHPESEDELEDPWACGERVFSRVADQVELTVGPLAQVLLGEVELVPRSTTPSYLGG